MMRQMTMRDRMMAVLKGQEHDRVPFVMYDGMLPADEVREVLGRDRIGLMRWTSIHRIETPRCRYETEDYLVDGATWQRTTIHTPKGSICEERGYVSSYESRSIRKHYVQEPEDYEVLWALLEDGVVLEDYDRYYREEADLGDDGIPLVAIERTPYQQLWVQWVGLDTLGYHLVDYPDRVAHTVDLLSDRARRIFEIANRSPAPFIDFPDNITAPAIGPQRFRQYCVPLYDELADMLAGRDALVDDVGFHKQAIICHRGSGTDHLDRRDGDALPESIDPQFGREPVAVTRQFHHASYLSGQVHTRHVTESESPQVRVEALLADRRTHVGGRRVQGMSQGVLHGEPSPPPIVKVSDDTATHFQLAAVEELGLVRDDACI